MKQYKGFRFTKLNRISVFEMLSGVDWNGIKNLLDGWKEGTVGYLSLNKAKKPKSKEQLGYYYAVILPLSVDAFRVSEDFSLVIEAKGKKFEVELTRDNMDIFLKTRYAALTGDYVDKGDMSMAECSAYEEWCIKWVAKWLNFQIPPSDPNWRERTGQ